MLTVRRKPDYPLAEAGKPAGIGPLPRWWLGGDAVASAWFTALSACFPRGEAFFIESVRAARDGASGKLAHDIADFIAQEANHSREHIAFNRALNAAGHDFTAIDARVAMLIARAQARRIEANLAATMALEHFTAILAEDLLRHPELLAGCDPAVAELWRWHAIEEVEHKAVAFDTYRHATREWSRTRRWLLKAVMMLVVSRSFFANRIGDSLDLLAQGGERGWRMRWRLARYLFGTPGVLRRVLPAWLAYFTPGFHPAGHGSPIAELLPAE